jgi:hypothetical protein
MVLRFGVVAEGFWRARRNSWLVLLSGAALAGVAGVVVTWKLERDPILGDFTSIRAYALVWLWLTALVLGMFLRSRHLKILTLFLSGQTLGALVQQFLVARDLTTERIWWGVTDAQTGVAIVCMWMWILHPKDVKQATDE